MKSCNTIISEKPAQEVFNNHTGFARRVPVGDTKHCALIRSLYKSLGEEVERREADEAAEEKARREANAAYFEEEQRAYQESCAKRGDLKNEIYFGDNPVLESHAKAVNELLHPDDVPLYWHLYSKGRRTYKNKKSGLVFADSYFRDNKVIRGTKLLRKCKYERIERAGLLKFQEGGTLRKGVALYSFTPLSLQLELDSLPKTFSEFMEANLVNPVTGKIHRKREFESLDDSYNFHDMDEARHLAPAARRFERGLRVQLAEMYRFQYERKNSVEYRKALETPLPERSREQVSLIASVQSDDYNLLGTLINGRIPLPNGEAILFQSFKPTSSGRFALRDGGFLNLSSELKDIGLKHCSVVQYRYDLKAAQVNLFLQVADEIGVSIPELDRYASDRKTRDEWAEQIGYGCTGQVVKDAILSLTMCASLPSPDELDRSIEKHGLKAVDCYSFARPFFELGGMKCYARAYEVFKPIINGARQVQDYLYDHNLSTAPQYKGKIRVTNAVGCKKAFWDYKTKEPIEVEASGAVEVISEKELKRKLVAFILQGMEQKLIQDLALSLDDSYLIWNEHDGFITNKPVFWEKRGRMELECEVVGGYVAEEPVEEIESFTDLSELPVLEIEQPTAPIVESIEPVEATPAPEVIKPTPAPVVVEPASEVVEQPVKPKIALDQPEKLRVGDRVLITGDLPDRIFTVERVKDSEGYVQWVWVSYFNDTWNETRMVSGSYQRDRLKLIEGGRANEAIPV